MIIEKFRLGKRGVVKSFIVTLILILVAFLLVLAWMYRTGIIFDTDIDMNLCRATLALQAKTQPDVGIWDWNSPLVTQCKRRIIEITASSIVMKRQSAIGINQKMSVWLPNGPDSNDATGYRNTASYKEVNEEVLQSFFADSLRRCWLMGLEGEMKIFNDEGNFMIRKTGCVICDQISVRRGIATPTTLKLSEYLEKTVVPSVRKGEFVTNYNEFLDRTGHQSEADYPSSKWCLEKHGIQDDINLRDGTYATVLIRYYQDKDWLRTGLGKECSASVIVPAERLRSMCQIIAN